MGDKTGIEWTDATWNPVTGCTKVSPGCDHCYAEAIAERFRGKQGHYYEGGFDIQLRPKMLGLPLSRKWEAPRRIFVNSMSDLFHALVPDDYIARVFAVMALAPQHTFQVLTKRHGRMRSLLTSSDFHTAVAEQMLAMTPEEALSDVGDVLPLPNVWLGVSVEDQQRAELRIPALWETPAAVRWISAEPLLGGMELLSNGLLARDEFDRGIDWVVVGGESGHGARPMHPWWVKSLRAQCFQVEVPFLFKQWGDWTPLAPLKDGKFDFSKGIVMTDDGNTYDRGDLIWPDGPRVGEAIRADYPHHHPTSMYRVGKKKAGRELYHDGRTFDGYPEAVPA